MPKTLPPPRRRPVPAGPPAAEPAAPPRRWTEAEYLARERSVERATEARTELHANGTLFEMSGARRPHSLLVRDLNRAFDGFLDLDRWEYHSESLKFRPPACRFFYPDGIVVPNPPELLDEIGDVVRDPLFVGEVLSDSTEHVDRGEKQTCYLNTPSVLEYWLIAQDRVRIERHHRPDPAADWAFDIYEDRAGSVPLPALGGAVAVRAVYRRALPAG